MSSPLSALLLPYRSKGNSNRGNRLGGTHLCSTVDGAAMLGGRAVPFLWLQTNLAYPGLLVSKKRLHHRPPMPPPHYYKPVEDLGMDMGQSAKNRTHLGIGKSLSSQFTPRLFRLFCGFVKASGRFFFASGLQVSSAARSWKMCIMKTVCMDLKKNLISKQTSFILL